MTNESTNELPKRFTMTMQEEERRIVQALTKHVAQDNGRAESLAATVHECIKTAAPLLAERYGISP